jgi:alpha-L-fucosidase
VEAFFTAKDDAVYAIIPRRFEREFVVDDIEATAGVRVTLLEGGAPVEAKLEGKRLTIGIPDSLAALPARDAYVLKIAGAR